MKIAVVGSGIAGLCTAWRLSSHHTVTLIERRDRVGMDADSLLLPSAQTVDVPLRVFHRGYYPTLCAIYDEAGVDYERVNYASSFSTLAGETYFRYLNARFAGVSIPYLSAQQWRNPGTGRMAWDILRFLLIAPRTSRRYRGYTLAEYLELKGYSQLFRDGFLRPSMAGICTCSYASVDAYPADIVIDYLASCLNFEGVSRVVSGTAEVIKRLTRDVTLRTSCGVAHIELQRDDVTLIDEAGEREQFEHIVIATQANHARSMLDPSPLRELLGDFEYERNEVVMHSDPTLAPSRREDWAPVNFLVSPLHPHPMATIHMNQVQPDLRRAPLLLQTWGPLRPPREDLTLASASFERPLVTLRSRRALHRLEELQKIEGRRLWLCGAYAYDGVPLLEGAAASALNVAQAIGPTQ